MTQAYRNRVVLNSEIPESCTIRTQLCCLSILLRFLHQIVKLIRNNRIKLSTQSELFGLPIQLHPCGITYLPTHLWLDTKLEYMNSYLEHMQYCQYYWFYQWLYNTT